MSAGVYNTLTCLLLDGAILALAFAVGLLILAMIGWRGAHRKKRLLGFAIALACVPVLIAIQQTLLWHVYLPSLGREAAQLQLEYVDKVSLVRVGEHAPSFTVVDVDGHEFNLGSQRGKTVLLNFFATWCGPCIQEVPELQKIWSDNRSNRNFEMIVLGREETDESISAFKRDHGYTFPMASDPKSSVYSLYAKELIPRTYLISQDGIVCYAFTGFNEEDLASLRKILGQRLKSTN